MFFGYAVSKKKPQWLCCDQSVKSTTQDHRQILLLFPYSTALPCDTSESLHRFPLLRNPSSKNCLLPSQGVFSTWRVPSLHGNTMSTPRPLAEVALETLRFLQPCPPDEETLPAITPKAISPGYSQLSLKFLFEFIRINLMVCYSCCQDDRSWFPPLLFSSINALFVRS